MPKNLALPLRAAYPQIFLVLPDPVSPKKLYSPFRSANACVGKSWGTFMSFMFVRPEDGFTSDVIKDSKRFVGRDELVENCISALNSTQGLIAVYGKRGVGKSSLLRQIQKM